MSEDHGHRSNAHLVMLTAELQIALVKLQAALEIGDKYAALYAMVRGLFDLGYLSQEHYDLHIKRYSQKLVDVVKEKRAQRESSHVPVLTLEKQKEKQQLDQKDKQFQGMLEQWDQHPSPQWRKKVLADAEKWKDKLASARALLDRAQKDAAT